ncbi:hypothetical protein MNB_SV-12-1362 [hydrothermal vent metagenome]|uniref:Uncharacterized protein n=1 Tax=hydrothermal vent metagenome TaxID=652676 RepID=A0A1W1CKT4_9ZZZZ
MEFKYKCPVCRANNTLSSTNLYCRRCKSNLTSIYNIKKRGVFRVLKALIYTSNY